MCSSDLPPLLLSLRAHGRCTDPPASPLPSLSSHPSRTRQVCTDVMHVDQRRLAYYRGNYDDFRLSLTAQRAEQVCVLRARGEGEREREKERYDSLCVPSLATRHTQSPSLPSVYGWHTVSLAAHAVSLASFM